MLTGFVCYARIFSNRNEMIIKPLLALMFMGLGLHDINVSLNQEKADSYGQFIGTNQNFVLSGFAQELPITVYILGTKTLLLSGLHTSVGRPHNYICYCISNWRTSGCTTGTEHAHLRWKPPKNTLHLGDLERFPDKAFVSNESFIFYFNKLISRYKYLFMKGKCISHRSLQYTLPC